jgi:hypothetical protein
MSLYDTRAHSEHAEKDRATIRVDLGGRGAWEVVLPDRPDHLTCQTLADAQRTASAQAARRRPCELIVRDAYHRVLHRELVNGMGDS